MLDVALVITGTIKPWQTLEETTLPGGIVAASEAMAPVSFDSTPETPLDVRVNGSTAYLRHRMSTTVAMSSGGSYAKGQAVFFVAQ